MGIWEGEIAGGRIGPVVDGGDLGFVGPAVDVVPVVDVGGGVWVAEEEKAMSASGPLGGTGGGTGELDNMATVGTGRRVEEVGGAVEVWTHRWSSGNVGNCKRIGGSMIDTVSNTFIASLIERRKMFFWSVRQGICWF